MATFGCNAELQLRAWRWLIGHQGGRAGIL